MPKTTIFVTLYAGAPSRYECGKSEYLKKSEATPGHNAANLAATKQQLFQVP